MISLFNNGLVGIEVSNDSIRAAKIKRTLSGFKLVSFGYSYMPDDLFENGMIKDPKRVSEIIKQVLSKAAVNETDVAVSLSSRYIFFKKVTLKDISLEMLERIYVFEASHHFPVSLESFTVDYHILKMEKGKITVLFTAAKNEIIKNRIDTIKQAGLKPLVIEPDLLSILNLNSFLTRKNGKAPKEELIIKLEKDFSFIIDPKVNDPSFIFVPAGKVQLEKEDKEATGTFLSVLLRKIETAKTKRVYLTGEEMPRRIIKIINLKDVLISNFQPFNHISGNREFIVHSGFLAVPLGLTLRRAGDK